MKNLVNEKPSDELFGRKKYILEHIDSEDITGKKILNIGCGFGWFEYNIMEKADHVWGIEPNPDDLNTAKNYFKDNAKTTFLEGSAIEIPFEDGFFDTVVSWDVIEHIPKGTEKKMLKEIERVLVPGGTFYLTTPHKNFINCFLDPAWWLIGHRHYKEQDMQKIVSSAKTIKIERISVKGGLSAVINVLNLYIAKWIFRRKPFFENYMNKKEDMSWKKEKGIFTLCLKGKKSV